MILESIASIFGGGLTGLIGSGINLYGQNKKQKHELNRLKLEGEQEYKNLELEMRHADKKADREQETTIIKNDTGLLVSAINSDQSTYSKGVAGALVKLGEKSQFATIMGTLALSGLALCDITKGLLRPVVTAYLTYSVIATEGETALQAKIYMAGSAIGFYFGSRTLGKVFKSANR